MSKKKELKAELDSMAAILFSAIENFEYVSYLHTPISQAELDLIEKNTFFKHLRHLAWQMTVIELAKLVSPSNNQKLNIYKLISKFKVHYKTFAVPNYLIPIWQGSIFKHGNTIVALNEIRDKLYAHTDLDNDSDLKELKEKSFLLLETRELLFDLQATLNFIAEVTQNMKYVMPNIYYLKAEFKFLSKLTGERSIDKEA
jgi:hypothetical protein